MNIDLTISKEIYELLDTIIKIGLGSAIGAFSTYKAMKLTHKHNKEKFVIDYKTKKIEEVAGNIEIYFNKLYDYLYIVGGLAQKMENEKRNLIYDNEFEELENKGNVFLESWENIGSAVSQLKLLKMNNIAGKILEHIVFANDKIRNRIINKEMPKLVEIEKSNDQLNKIENELFELLASEHEKIIR